MKKLFIGILLGSLGFTACNKLDQLPQSTASRAAVFGTENGLKLYTNSFYGMGFLPRNSIREDVMSDYLAVKSVDNFIREGGYAANNSSGWTWTDLRNINYFIQNNNDPAIPQAIRNNYMGIARYFRAYFYMEKVKRFGDVPWIGPPLDTDDPALTDGRDKRELVMDSVLADLDFATSNIQASNDPSRTTITKWVAYAYKSRVCLFEGTYRKYHTELNLMSSANKWLEQSASASDQIIKNGGFSINTAGGPGSSYRQVFTSPTPLANEVLQAAVADVSLGVLNDANWWWTSGTYGSKASFIRTFINTYLNLDGTPFTNNPAYKT
ncbi:MAG: SusD/RagB family nutrient-binding outer membrane lipoprotein, partial [Segetibacter sp.]